MFLVITTQHHRDTTSLTSVLTSAPTQINFSRYFSREISSNSVWYQSSVIDSNWLHYKTALLGKYGHHEHLTAEENTLQIEFEVVLLFLLLLLLLLLLIYLYLCLLHQTTKIAYVGSENFIWNRIYSELAWYLSVLVVLVGFYAGRGVGWLWCM